MMAWPEKFFFRGGVQKMPKFFSLFWVLFDVDFGKAKKKGGAHTIFFSQKFGPRGLDVDSVFFSRHPHPPKPHIGCAYQPLDDFWGLGTTWPHSTAQKCRVGNFVLGNGKGPHRFWDGAPPLAQGGPPSGRIEHVVKKVPNATSQIEIFGAQVDRNKGDWREIRTIAGPGESDAWEHLGNGKVIRTCLLDFFSHQTCKLAETIIVNVSCHFSRSEYM